MKDFTLIELALVVTIVTLMSALVYVTLEKPEPQPGVVIQVPFREDGVMCYVDRDSGSMSCIPYYFEPEETNNEQP